MTVVETPFFLQKAPGLLTDDEREQLIVSAAERVHRAGRF